MSKPEQELGQEQDLKGFCCEYFYVCENCLNERRLCHKLNTNSAFLLCVSPGDAARLQTERKPGHIGGSDTVFLRYEFSCEFSSCLTGRRTLYTWSRSKESCHCVSSGVSLGEQTERKSGHTGGRGRVSLRCEFSYESSNVVNWRTSLYTQSRSKEYHRDDLFGVSSGYWTWRKICHKQGRGRAVLQYGSGDVTLSVKSKKTT